MGAPLGFDLDVDIQSDASPEDKLRLLEAGCKGCFLEQTMGQVNTINHRLMLDGDWVSVDV